MPSDGQIVFEVTADGKHAIADIKDITKAIQDETKKWDQAADDSAKKIDSSFSGLLKKLAAGFSAVKIGQALLDIGKDALQAASDLQEVQNVVDVTFGSSASKIDAWAKAAGNQFGLTETQAKRYTSTIGAMAKSSGMAGEEITQMSTDLAGLAADMASFYNLDFDTAFQKIRSGISGETEPLKQLGINMSVANLEAYALSQGITKAFNDMSQGEQTMLRYQYLMQATADAQGDFARTSDGYANSLRQLETNLNDLSTKMGEFLIGPAAQITGWLNDFLGSLMPEERPTTVLDDFANIDINTEGKLSKIQQVATEAGELVDVLDSINKTSFENTGLQSFIDDLASIDLKQDKTTVLQSFLTTLNNNIDSLAQIQGTSNEEAKKWLEGIAESAQGLKPNDVKGWTDLLGELRKGLPGIENTDFGKQFFGALQEGFEQANPEQIKEFITTLGSNISVIKELSGKDAEGAKKWLEEIGAAADSLSPDDAEGWKTLLDSIREGLPGIENTDVGKPFFESLSEGFSDISDASSLLDWAISKVGDESSRTEAQQALWLQTCKQLVSTIPGLSSLINVETGEIKGGTQAVKDYIKAWEEGQTKLAMMGALQQKEDAFAQRFSDLPGLELDMVVAKRRAKNQLEELKKIYTQYGVSLGFGSDGKIVRDFSSVYGLTEEDKKRLNDATDAFEETYQKAQEATDIYNEQADALKEAKEAMEEYRKAVDEMPGSVEAAGDSFEDLEEKEKKAAEAAKTVTDAVLKSTKELADYAQKVRDSVAKSVDSIIKGFGTVEKSGDKTREKARQLAEQEQTALNKYNLTKWMKDGVVDLKAMEASYDKLTKTEKEAYNELAKIHNKQVELDKELNEQGPSGMKAGLQSQIAYMEEYLSNLDKAREMGLSKELLASLSDGSAESAEYLSALVGAGPEAAKEIDTLYQQVQGKKKEFTDALTGQQLTADEVYQNMAAAAKAAVDALDLGAEAKENAGKTVAEMAQGIADQYPAVQSAVDSILSEMARLSGLGVNIDFGSFGSVNVALPEVPQHETGLNYVPFDGYLASLHEGEGILSAEENRIWQRFRDGGNTIDYDTMGGVMRDNIHAGGNVYLDSRIVGSVISEQQGRSYRQLQRSGWQA